jgi:amino acid permease
MAAGTPKTWALILGIVLLAIGAGVLIFFMIEYFDKKNKKTHVSLLIGISLALIVIGVGFVVYYIITKKKGGAVKSSSVPSQFDTQPMYSGMPMGGYGGYPPPYMI